MAFYTFYTFRVSKNMILTGPYKFFKEWSIFPGFSIIAMN